MSVNRTLRQRAQAWVWICAASVFVTLLSSTAWAQQTGGIRGRVMDAASGQGIDSVVVIATSPSLQGEEMAVSEPDGRFEITLLPPGSYEVRFEADGYRSQVVQGVDVAVGRDTPVTLDLAPTTIQAEEIEVVVAPPTVDRGATDTRTALSQEFIQKTPSGRTFTRVMEETPGASGDTYGVGVMGSTGVENSIVIEGLNVTAVDDGQSAANLSTDFFEVLEMKTSGYMPEFGRSTGGIYNMVLQSGSNEFHGTVFGNIAPSFLQAEGKTFGRVGDALLASDHLAYNADFGFGIGGPIIKDKLWFYAAFNPRLVHVDNYRTTRRDNGDGTFDELEKKHFNYDVTTYFYAGKLTYAFNENNRLSVSYFGNPETRRGASGGVASGQSSYFRQPYDVGSNNVTANFSSQMFDGAFQVEAFAGAHVGFFNYGKEPNVPTVSHTTSISRPDLSLAEFETGPCDAFPADCPITSYVTGGPGYWQEDDYWRLSGGLRLTHLFAGHRVRYGADIEERQYNSLRGYSGGYFETNYGGDPGYFGGNGYATGESERTYYATQDASDPDGYRRYGQEGVRSDVRTRAYAAFLQDQWEINKWITVNGGLRWDAEHFYGASGKKAFSVNDMFAPRLGVAVDPTGEGRARVFANWGWYYESIPLGISKSSFSQLGTLVTVADDQGRELCRNDDLGEAVPVGAAFSDGTIAQAGANCTLTFYAYGGSDAPVVKDLKGQYVQDIVLGAEYSLTRDWKVGITAIRRSMERIVEDISADDGGTYVIANPGVNDCDVGAAERASLAAVCSDADGNYDSSKTLFPEPKRAYYGLVFSAEKRMSDHYQLLASYTLSRLSGNYPGLFQGDTGSLGLNISTQYDLLSLTPNRSGLLPGDRTHHIKVSGSYDMVGVHETLRGLTLGGSYSGRSGVPINYLGAHEGYGAGESFIMKRGSAGRTPFVHSLDLAVNYDIPLAGDVILNFNASLFNVLNLQQTTAVDNEYTTEAIDPQNIDRIEDARVNSQLDADGNPNPDNDGDGEPDYQERPPVKSENFKNATAYQSPFGMRLGVRLTF